MSLANFLLSSVAVHARKGLFWMLPSHFKAGSFSVKGCVIILGSYGLKRLGECKVLVVMMILKRAVSLLGITY